MKILKSGCFLVLFCLVICVTAKKHSKKLDHKHRHLVKRQATNSYANWLKSSDEQSSYSNSQDSNSQSNYPSDYSSTSTNNDTIDGSSQASVAETEQIAESQPAWCQDNKMCTNFHRSDCKEDKWVQLNCARKCNLCTETNDKTDQATPSTNNSPSTSTYKMTADSSQTTTKGSDQDRYSYTNDTSDTTNAYNSPSTDPYAMTADSNQTTTKGSDQDRYSYSNDSSDTTNTYNSPNTDPYAMTADSNQTTTKGSDQDRYSYSNDSSETTNAYNSPSTDPYAMTADSNQTTTKSSNKDQYSYSNDSSDTTNAYNSPSTDTYAMTADSNQTTKDSNQDQYSYSNDSPDTTSILGTAGEKLNYNYTMEVEDYAEPKKEKAKKPKKLVFSEENISITLPGASEKKVKEKKTSKKVSWCKDSHKCKKIKKSECNNSWMQLNCPKRCGICQDAESSSVAEDHTKHKEKKKGKKKFKGYVEDIRITLPAKMVAPEQCKDHVECIEYPVSSCHKEWMKINCRDKCALCKGKSKKLPTTKTDEYTLNENGDGSGVCYYDGVPHENGSKWSPGPCTPECDCQNGNVRCTVIQCPKLTCDRQEKKRWSCCPKCLDQDDSCVKATEGSSSEKSSCCVLPFIFKGVQYETCTSEDHDQPWCSLTENFDLDGKWGVCVEPRPVSKSVQHFATENQNIRVEKPHHENDQKEATKHHHNHPRLQHKPKMVTHAQEKYHHHETHKKKEKLISHEDSQVLNNEQLANDDNVDEDEEEILQKYGNRTPEKKLEVEPEPLDGGFTEWSAWSKCLVSCGGGVQERYRKCSRPPPAFGGLDCRHLGSALESRECNTSPCPVNGGFGNWGPWIECSATCGGGLSSRSRVCDNPSPKYGGKDCVVAGLGPAIESKACNGIPCIDKGAFSPWSDWTKCDKKCGGGISVRRRTCTSPLSNGHDCNLLGSETQTKSCNTAVCAVDGGYTPWTEWSLCSRSCGPGITSRHRTCTQPTPSETGNDCSRLGQAFEQKACHVKDCKSTGNWKAWSDWNKCSLSCGGGLQTRTRKCVGKTSCEGNDKQTQLCNANHCPIHGKYSDWSKWGKCSESCGDGKTTRTRKCNNPSPRFGGKTCKEQELGPSEDTVNCNVMDCQVSRDGGFNFWSGWTKCSVTCGPGIMSRYRACDDPRPQGNGKDCSRLGVPTQTAPCYNRQCPVHGNYSDWSSWSKCSVTCGDGSRTRKRSCTNPVPEDGGDSCANLGEDIESEPCFESPCDVSAKYGDWAQWSGCTKSCGYGIRRRERRCLGASQFGENYCDEQGIGLAEEAERCFERSCPVDGNFSPWSAWSECSASCGGGAKSRFRNCSDPVPMHGGRGCEGLGASFETKSCGENYCPVDGGYSNWSQFGPCSRTCGTGKEKRKRTCTSPLPEHGGKDCSELGPTEDVQKCATDPCPVHGGYNDWSAWSNCSTPCGNGIMVRSRACTNPAPTFGGQDCVSIGPRKEQQNCARESCPEQCTCGGWTSWSECSKSCGGGFQTRKRQCTPPKSGLESCENEEQATQLCNLDVCPVDGGYSDWTAWSSCVGDCGTGYKSRSRQCIKPTPAFGGRTCQEVGLGQPYETASCLNDPCPVHGKYSSWSPWSACSNTCGLGQRKRTRLCDNPVPSNGGLDCSRYGQSEQLVDCFVADCPVDGYYSPWTEWSECSKSCGWGHQSRDRQCDSPEPARGGKDCTSQGGSSELQPCMMVECPVDGHFTKWSGWGECSKTCGDGKKRRKRFCTSPTPAFGGKSCQEQKLGNTAEISNCNLGPCPDTGGWGEWSLWSYCSASCGRGKMERSRVCDSPKPVGGGKPCVGLVSQQKDCSIRDCPVNGNYTNWGPWTGCDVKCGSGFESRWRSCSNPVTSGGGQECTTFAPDYESRTCEKDPCKVDGNWAAWSEWTTCSKTCGDGVQVRTRICNDPEPEAGGLKCYGDSKEEKYCRTRDCCDIPYVDLGCFVDTGNPSTMPEVLMTDTDRNSPLFSGVEIKQAEKDWDDYMSNLICRCAQMTTQKGYSHFGIQNLGECRSGPIAEKNFASQGARVAFTTNGPRPWVGCLGKDQKQCRRPSLNCVGQDQTNYVYGLKNIAPINGNYTGWSDWSLCSKSCGRGITSRRRSCTNPPALYEGKDCSSYGPEEDIRECYLKDCPVNGAWSGWADWSKCSVSCGTGRRTRIRSCSSPVPSSGGDICSGPDTEIAECFQSRCPSDGRWSDWQAWEPCSVSCGYGVQIRTRYCNNPPPKDGGKMCEGDLMESTPCEANPCPVHGNYADWSNWSGCSRSCGRGSKVRVRKCTNPVPRFGGESCKNVGPAEEKVHCNANSCPVNGNWGIWSSWSKCSSECGPGVRTRERRCSNPYPNYGGKQCSGLGFESTACSMPDCPVHGNWGKWSMWSECQNDCGVATRDRTRACNNPPPAHGGRGCEGVAEEFHDCKLDQCPINGAFSDWSSWGACDKPCGSGHKFRVRSCSNPEPRNGGMNCSAQGPEYESVACNTDPCPVNGAWSGWTSWSSCSQTCGMGLSTRSRTCSYPVPEFGGKQCDGKTEETKSCKDSDCCELPYKDIGCYIDTQRTPRPLPELLFSERDKISWKNWKSFMSDLICKCAKETRNNQYSHFGIQHYGECYSGPESWKTYRDEGERQDFTRPPDAQPWVGCVDNQLNQCNEPNLLCVGKQNTNYVYTIDQVRPVNGNYSDWSSWSSCSSSCGAGARYRTRSCSNPAPSFSGQPCYNMGSDEDIEACYQSDCPVDGGWGNWGDWTTCSANCGSGTINRQRSCDSPKPNYGGEGCKGPKEETVKCNLHDCPVDGLWSSWSSWSQCSSSCGNGQQSRKRDCNKPKAEYGGNPCVGSSVLYQNCVEKECPGVWGDWSDWSECSRTCGSGGTHTRSRTCQGGQICHGPRHDTKHCQLQSCPECTKSADVAFILDSSDATDQSIWNQMKSFARGIANAFYLHDDATRVGLITYSTHPTLELAFDEKNDRDEFSDFLNTVSPNHGTSDLQSALAMANDQLFTTEAGMRTKVPNVAIFMTENGPTASYANDSARDLKEKGVTVIGVGIGNKVDQYELQRVSSGPEYAFMTSTLEDAIGSIATVANMTCLAKPSPPQVKWGPWSDWSTCSRLCDAGTRHRTRSCVNGDQCMGKGKEEEICSLQKCPECKSTLDIVFAIPIADSISKSQLDNTKRFVQGVIDGQQVSPQGSHVGLLGYFDYPRVELKLDTFYDKDDISRALYSMEPVDGFNNTRIDLALTAAQNDMFSQANGVRAYVPKVLVILASGDATDQNLKAASMPLKAAGVTIIPLVTGDLETKSVAPMGTSTRDYFASDTIENLASKLNNITKQLCSAPLLAIQPARAKLFKSRKPTKHQKGAGVSKFLQRNSQSRKGMAKLVLKTAKRPTQVTAPTVNKVVKPNKIKQHVSKKQLDKQHKEAVSPFRSQTSVVVAKKPAAQKLNKVKKVEQVEQRDKWNNWSSWSKCSKTCGSGQSTRIRKCAKKTCAGRPSQSRPCNVQDCFTCNHDLDLVFAVDSSEAIPKEGWGNMKSFMTRLLDAFPVSERDTHVGILTFSSIPYLETRLSENFKKDDIVSLITNMKQLQGKQRRIDKALRMASAEFFSPKSRGFRDGVSKVLVLITGGNPTEGSESLATAIRPLEQNGVSVLALGIGPDIDKTQLSAIGGKQKNYMEVSDYDELLSSVAFVVKDVCQGSHSKPPPLPPPSRKVKGSKVTAPKTPPGGKKKLTFSNKEIQSLINKWGSWSNWEQCSKTCGEGQRSRSRDCVGYNCTGPAVEKEACFLQDCPDCPNAMDLVFAIDSSDDIVDREFIQEKYFVMDVMNAFRIGKDETRIGVATYGGDVANDILLTNQFDKDSLLVAVNSMIRSKGKKNLEQVLEAARTKLFTGSRDRVAKVLVLLTADKKKMSLSSTVSELSQSLKKSGIEVVAVGAGSADVTTRDMLGKVATNPSRVFPITSFDELVNNVYLVATSACQVIPSPAPESSNSRPAVRPSICTKPMDIAFALDSSDDVSSFQWQQQKDFVQRVINGLQIGPDKVHTGIMSYAAMPSIDLQLNARSKDKQGLIQTLQGLDRAVGKRNIASLLDMSNYELFSTKSGRRQQTPSAFVVLQYGLNRVGSKRQKIQKIKETAANLRRSGVRVFVVGVGSKVSRSDMARITSSSSDIIHLPSLTDRYITKKLIKKLCQAKALQREEDKVALALQNIKPSVDEEPKKEIKFSAKPGQKHKNIPEEPVTKSDSKTSFSKSSENGEDIAATSCLDLKRRRHGAKDGEFPIMFSPHCTPVNVFCYGMETVNPTEYLSLTEDTNENRASFHKERLKDFTNCDGEVDPSPTVTAPYWGTTRFSKIRVNPKNGRITQDDFRFAISEGNPVKYGRGGDCFSGGKCRRGGFTINLSGTGMKVRDDTSWKSWGSPKFGRRMINFTKSFDGTKVSAVCGGSCGGCQPKNGRIYVVPTDCNSPPAKNIKRRSVIEALEVGNKASEVHVVKHHHHLRHFHTPRKHNLKKHSFKKSLKGLKKRNKASTN